MAKTYSVRFESEIPLTLRDGTLTYMDMFRPDASGKFPALLQRTPYDKAGHRGRWPMLDPVCAAMGGYAVVIQDCRGRYISDGDFYPLVNEIDDGYDSVEWVASQSWCTGKVGMFGGSYVGATQWLAAITPAMTASDYHEGWTFQGGAFELRFLLSWTIGALAWENWAGLSRRLSLSDAQLESLIDAKDDIAKGTLTAPYWFLPMQELPDLKGGLAPIIMTGSPTQSTTTTGKESISRSPIRRSRSRPSTSADGTIFSWAGLSATS